MRVTSYGRKLNSNKQDTVQQPQADIGHLIYHLGNCGEVMPLRTLHDLGLSITSLLPSIHTVYDSPFYIVFHQTIVHLAVLENSSSYSIYLSNYERDFLERNR